MKLQATYKPKLLKLAAYTDPVLRTKTVTVDFPLSNTDQQLIADMIYSIQPAQLKKAKAPWKQASGMAANQWGISKSIFLYCPTGDSIKDLEVVINPTYIAVHNPLILDQTNSEDNEWEGCFSVPLATGNIKRAKSIRVKYQDQNGNIIERELEGWAARVWQHENDHLNGYLYDSTVHGRCLEKKTFDSLAAVDLFYDRIHAARKKGEVS